ncbi:MAG: regulatory protein [Oceanicoccus sp.]
MNCVVTDISRVDIRRAAMDFLAFREHSVQELVTKLSRRFRDSELSIDLLTESIASLTDDNLQSDRRFAESFVRSRIQKRHGPLRITNDLTSRGVSATIVSEVLGEANVDWRVVLEELSDRKYGQQKPADVKEKAKRIRFFQYRGFSYEYIRQILAE